MAVISGKWQKKRVKLDLPFSALSAPTAIVENREPQGQRRPRQKTEEGRGSAVIGGRRQGWKVEGKKHEKNRKRKSF